MDEASMSRLSAEILSAARLEITSAGFTKKVMDTVLKETRRRQKRRIVARNALGLLTAGSALGACILNLGQGHVPAGSIILSYVQDLGHWIMDQASVLCPLVILFGAGLYFQQRLHRILPDQQ